MKKEENVDTANPIVTLYFSLIIKPINSKYPFKILVLVKPEFDLFTLENVLIAYTKTSAFAEFEENEKGTKTIGKVAELTIPSQDILKMIPPSILKTADLLIMFNGEVVYNSEGGAG